MTTLKGTSLSLVVILFAGLAVGFRAAAPAGDGEEAEFDEFFVFIEINASDGDAGLQGKLDGEPWSRTEVCGPDGRAVFVFDPEDDLAQHGVTEVAWESNEPPFTEFPLADFLKLFPAGTYEAEGETIEGGSLVSETELTHDIPAAPVVTSHRQDTEAGGVVFRIVWERVTDDFQGGPLQSDITQYIVVVEYDVELDGEEVSRQLTIDVPPNKLELDVPVDFLAESARGFKFEVGARETSGNTTFVEVGVERE